MTEQRRSAAGVGAGKVPVPGCGELLTYLLEDFQQGDAAGVGAVDDALGVLEAETHHSWVDDRGGDAEGTNVRAVNSGLYSPGTGCPCSSAQVERSPTTPPHMQDQDIPSLRPFPASPAKAELVTAGAWAGDATYLICCVSGFFRLYWCKWENRLTLVP